MSEERWRSVFETSTLGIILTDHNHRFLDTNRALQAMLGYYRGGTARAFAGRPHGRGGARGGVAVVSPSFEKANGPTTRSWPDIGGRTARRFGSIRSSRPFLADENHVADLSSPQPSTSPTDTRRKATCGGTRPILPKPRSSATRAAGRGIPRPARLFWSQEEWRIFGLDPETTQLSYQVFLELVHPEDRAALEEVSLRAVRNKRGL